MPRNQPPQDPEDHKYEDKEHPTQVRTTDPGRETDPLPHHRHQEVKIGDKAVEPKLEPDLADLSGDDLNNAEGPDA